MIKHTQKIKKNLNSIVTNWHIIIGSSSSSSLKLCVYALLLCMIYEETKSYKLAFTIQLHIFFMFSSALLLLAVHNCANSSSTSWLITSIVNNGNNQSTITHRAEDFCCCCTVDNETFECVQMKRNTKRPSSSSYARLKYSQSLSIFIFHSFLFLLIDSSFCKNKERNIIKKRLGSDCV